MSLARVGSVAAPELDPEAEPEAGRADSQMGEDAGIEPDRAGRAADSDPDPESEAEVEHESAERSVPAVPAPVLGLGAAAVVPA